MKNKRWMAVLAALGMVIAVSGCSGKDSAQTAVNEEENETAEVQETEKEEVLELTEEEEQELYNLYIGINNTMVGRLSDSLGKYFEYIDYQEEFTILREDYFCYSISDSFFEDLDRADELVAKKQEQSELDAAYVTLSPVVRELGTVLNEVYEYADEDTWQTDDYAHGKELHARLWSACVDYETAGSEFVEKLGGVASEQRAADLEQMKEEGYEVTYALVKMISTAQEIQTAIYDQGIEDDSMMLELDTEALQPLYDQYMEEVEAVLGYMKDEEALANEGYPTQSAYYVTFEDAVENSAEELKEIFRKVAEQEAPSGISIVNVFTVDGSIAGFNNKVSAMIDDYNRMISY